MGKLINKMADKIDKSYNGLLVVKARNGNFNAGFDGNPRVLPDGTIFATDKALKYCVREYLSTFKDEPIFVRRNRYMKKFKEGNKGEKILYSYDTLEENYEHKFEKWKDKLFDNLNKEKIWEDENIMNILKKFLDIRLFGVVFSPKGKKKNISLTGPVQISYGVNKFEDSNIYPVQILSPYRNEKDKVKNEKDVEEVVNTTIGNEARSDEVYYVYNISVNKGNSENTEMTKEDLTKLKEALLNSVDPITSCTKYGCESIALVWLNNKENLILNNLDEFMKISKDNDGNIILNLEELKNNLEQYGFEGVEKEEYSLKETDFSKEFENKIHVLYKKGKLKLED